MHGLGGLQEQAHDHGMDVLADDERRGGRQQRDVAVGHVRGEIDPALAERHGGQEPIARRVGGRPPDAPEADGRTEQELAYQGHHRRHDEEGGVDPVSLERRPGGLARERDESRVLVGHAAVPQKAHRQGPDAAAFLADLDAEAAQVVEAADRHILPVKEPYRLVVEAPEREQPFGRRRLRGAALDEAGHGLAGRETPERLHRPGTGQDVEREPVRRREPPVLSRERVVGPARPPRAERDLPRGQGLDQAREDEEHQGQRRAGHDQVGQLLQVHELQSMRGDRIAITGFLRLPWGAAGGWITDQRWARFERPVWSRGSAPSSP